MLARLDPDPEAPVWDKLWERVCHQGTTYSASMAVLPYLLEAATKWKPKERTMPLALAGAIVLGKESSRTGHESTIGSLKQLALETLSSGDLSRYDRIHIMQSALAFQGDNLWGQILNRLLDGEFPSQCPFCKVDLFLVVGRHGVFCTDGDWVREPTVAKTKIDPANATRLDGTGKWLYEECLKANDPELGGWILHLSGSAECPQCKQAFEVPAGIELA